MIQGSEEWHAFTQLTLDLCFLFIAKSITKLWLLLLPEVDRLESLIIVFHDIVLVCYHVQTSHLQSVVESCSASLTLNPRYIKAITRRMKAQHSLGNNQEALMGELVKQTYLNVVALLSLLIFNFCAFYGSIYTYT